MQLLSYQYQQSEKYILYTKHNNKVLYTYWIFYDGHSILIEFENGKYKREHKVPYIIPFDKKNPQKSIDKLYIVAMLG